MDYRTEFEDLPTELFYLICGYLTGDNVIQLFLNLNSRFDLRVATFRLRTIDITDWSHVRVVEFFKRFYCSPAFSNSVIIRSLTLSNSIQTNFHSCGNIELVFASLLDNTELLNLFDRLQRLTFVRPLIDISICLPEPLLRSFIVHAIGDKIIFEKNFRSHGRDNIMVCSSETMRSMLAEDMGIYNQTFVHFEHLQINAIVLRVRHIKLQIENFDQQWPAMLSLINANIHELTLVMDNARFEFDDNQLFDSLLQTISVNCQFHFLIRIRSRLGRDAALLRDMFQERHPFFQTHRLDITSMHSIDFDRYNDQLLFIYTTPFCGSELIISERMETNGNCRDYTNSTRLTIAPNRHFDAGFVPNFLPENFTYPNLISLKLTLTHVGYTNVHHTSWTRFCQEIIPQLRFLSIDSRHSSLKLFEELLPGFSGGQLRWLYISETSTYCSVMESIFHTPTICSNIQHLKIDGDARLDHRQIHDISRNFLALKSLEFSIRFGSLNANEQLDTIGQYILFDMRSHLQYIRIHFEQERLTVSSIMPTAKHLGEWLGNNYERWLEHITTIELDRRGLAAWM